MTPQDPIKAFCYLGRMHDEKNKISLTENSLIISHKGKTDIYDLPQLKDLTFGHRKAMLYLLSGGIAVPFTAVAFYRDFLNPWPTLFLLFAGIFALYIGWMGYRVLTVHEFGQHRDYPLPSVSKNIKAFVEFALKLLPVNMSFHSVQDRMIFHITDAQTWKEKRTGSYFKGLSAEGFIHASNHQQVQGTLEKYFQNKTNLLLLTIDPLKVTPEIKYEDLTGEGQLFPHIYGHLNLDAIEKIEELGSHSGK